MPASVLLMLAVLAVAHASEGHNPDHQLVPGQQLFAQSIQLGSETRVYQLKELLPGAAYEVRVSWPASVSCWHAACIHAQHDWHARQESHVQSCTMHVMMHATIGTLQSSPCCTDSCSNPSSDCRQWASSEPHPQQVYCEDQMLQITRHVREHLCARMPLQLLPIRLRCKVVLVICLSATGAACCTICQHVIA